MPKKNELKYNKLKKSEDKGTVSSSGGKVVKTVLGGSFLSKDSSFRMLPFLFFLTLLGVIYIANIYYAEKSMRQIDDYHVSLKELRYEYISTHTKLMRISKQSELVKRLKPLNIKESVIPPYKIVYKKTKAD